MNTRHQSASEEEKKDSKFDGSEVAKMQGWESACTIFDFTNCTGSFLTPPPQRCRPCGTSPRRSPVAPPALPASPSAPAGAFLPREASALLTHSSCHVHHPSPPSPPLPDRHRPIGESGSEGGSTNRSYFRSPGREGSPRHPPARPRSAAPRVAAPDLSRGPVPGPGLGGAMCPAYIW